MDGLKLRVRRRGAEADTGAEAEFPVTARMADVRARVADLTGIQAADQRVENVVRYHRLGDEQPVSELGLRTHAVLVVLPRSEASEVEYDLSIGSADEADSAVLSAVPIERVHQLEKLCTARVWPHPVAQPGFAWGSSGIMLCRACATDCHTGAGTAYAAPSALPGTPFVCACASTSACQHVPEKEVAAELTETERSAFSVQLRRNWTAQIEGWMNHFNSKNPVASNAGQIGGRMASCLSTVLMYEDHALQEKARAVIPLEELQEAVRSPDAMLPVARDELLRQLLVWFKKRFFRWVRAPPCSFCSGKTTGIGSAAPTPAERNEGRAGIVEVYKCTLCETITRFPRYNHPGKLLETRAGRCGEWANCFTLLCRAMGYPARYVSDWTDHVWTEVWSDGLQAWVHTDCCEPLYNRPMTYEIGWKKKLNYIVAFAHDHVVDVTHRYTQQGRAVMTRRSLVPETWWKAKISGLHAQRLASVLDIEQRQVLLQRLAHEQRILAHLQRQADLRAFANAAARWSEEEMRGRISGSAADAAASKQ